MTRPRLPSHVAAGALALALAPAFWPTAAAAHTCDDPFSTDLIAGQTIDAGDVKVCNDDATLTITYEATYPWCLLETNLHVATVPEPPADPDANIPQNRPGNPIPGQFAYGDEYGGCLDGTATFEIPLDEIDGGVGPGDTVAIAAHAEVEDGAREEGAWGKGTRFVARGNWAMYFTYVVQAPPPPASCICDTLSPGGIATGAELLEALCPDGALAPGATFLDEGVITSARLEGTLYTVLAVPAPGFAGRCSVQVSGSVAQLGLAQSEVEACQAHLRVSCGIQ
jgi:hypothetical protein